VACNSDFESNVRDGRPLESGPVAHRKVTTGSNVTLHYSRRMPVFLMSAAQVTVSLLMRAASSAGVVGSASSP